ncbi:MAG: preprotein translocase subunit SecG [Candidatus Adiutrix intracellularis]|nr:preprotein translocase subunit SecG [Candidatus Adiutrix intracellularis]
MNLFIIIIHISMALVLVLTVLLQAGKGAGMGAAFGGSSGSVFGTRGPATFISKITCIAAIIFMLTSLHLSLNQGNASQRTSVMEKWSETVQPPVTTPAETSVKGSTPANEPVVTPDALTETPAGGTTPTSAETPAIAE